MGQGNVSPGNLTYPDGTIADLTATPAAGWSFAGWSGDASGSTNTSITIDGDKTVTATFVQNTYLLTMITVGNGTVNPGNVTTCNYGDIVDIDAINATGWSFSGWSGDASGSSNTTLTMDGNLTVTATFVQFNAVSNGKTSGQVGDTITYSGQDLHQNKLLFVIRRLLHSRYPNQQYRRVHLHRYSNEDYGCRMDS